MLNDEFTDTIKTQTSGQITPSGNEAPILFERKGLFYLLFGHICCFCQQGSGALVYTAKHPLGTVMKILIFVQKFESAQIDFELKN